MMTETDEVAEPVELGEFGLPRATDLPQPSGLRRHLGIVRSHLGLIAACVALMVGAGIAYVRLTPKVYRSTSSILLESNAPRVLGEQSDAVAFDPRNQDPSLNSEFLETQYRILMSRDVLGRVVKKLRLDRDLDFLGIAPEEAVGIRAEKLAVKVLQKRVAIAPIRDSQLTEVFVDDTDPQRAANIANAVVSSYLESNLDRRLEATRSAAIWLADQMGELTDKLESSEVALFRFRKDNDILATSVEDRQNLLGLRLTTLTESLTRVTAHRVELEAAVAALDQTRASAKDGSWPLQIRAVANDPMLLDLRRQYTRLEGDAIRLSERYESKHPEKVAVDARLATLRTHIRSTMSDTVAGLRSEYEQARSAEAHLTRLIDEAKREAFEINKKQIAQRKLQREQDNNQRLYDLVLGRMKDADLAMLLKTNNVRVLDTAEVPERPVFPRAPTVLTLSLMMGLFGGVGLAYAADSLKRG